MPKTEDFQIFFYVIQDGEDNQYRWKVDASDEAEAIIKAPLELAAARRTLGKIPHNPTLVKVLMNFTDFPSS